jgi:chemotaxis protein methyltransferase CheR
MSADLKDNMVFSEHNLGTDGVFAETHLILCRNVLIYFDKEMQNEVLRVFRESLRHLGYLGLGSKENLRFSSQASAFDVVDEKLKIYQKRMVGS